jgi:hypothetical protein
MNLFEAFSKAGDLFSDDTFSLNMVNFKKRIPKNKILLIMVGYNHKLCKFL